MVEFIPLDESHIQLIRSWLSSGEARRWYGGDVPTTEEEVRQQYLIEKPQDGTHCFLIRFGGEPIGHIQYYRAGDYPEWCSLVAAGVHDYGLDLFPKLVKEDVPIYGYPIADTDYLLDIGTIDHYESAQKDWPALSC